MAGEIFFSFFFGASSCTPAAKHPLWHYHLSSVLFRPNQKEGEKTPSPAGRLVNLPGREMTIKRLLTLPVLPVVFTVPVIS